MKVWVEVSEERLTANFRIIATASGPETQVMAIVKADAYGHGAEVCAPILARAGARWLGVTCVNEGARVRAALDHAGFARGAEGTPEILVMCGFLPEDVGAFQDFSLTPVIWTDEHVDWLSGFGLVRVHVEVDTGMGRQGVGPMRPLRLLMEKMDAAGLVLDGIFTHFAAAETVNSPITLKQQQLFEEAIGLVRARARDGGTPPRWIHAGNSSTIDNPPQRWPWLVKLAKSLGASAMVRSGIALYGYCMPLDGPDAKLAEPKVRPALKPVMSWKAHVLAVRKLAIGDTVGYGATFTATDPMRVALLPVGYADGLRRELSGPVAGVNPRPGGWVLVRGRDGARRPVINRAPIIGRISMNLTVIDVTGNQEIKAGDEVLLLGDGVTAEDHARLAGTIPYEILCGIRQR